MRISQHSPLNSSWSKSKFPAIRDCGLGAASRDRFKKQLSFIKIHYNYERFSRMTDEVGMRRSLVKDLQENYPQIDDISYDNMINMDLVELSALIESRKLEMKMHVAAVRIQR